MADFDHILACNYVRDVGSLVEFNLDTLVKRGLPTLHDGKRCKKAVPVLSSEGPELLDHQVSSERPSHSAPVLTLNLE